VNTKFQGSRVGEGAQGRSRTGRSRTGRSRTRLLCLVSWAERLAGTDHQRGDRQHSRSDWVVPRNPHGRWAQDRPQSGDLGHLRRSSCL